MGHSGLVMLSLSSSLFGRYCRKSLFASSGPNFKSRWRANEKITWGDRRQAVNSPATSVVELRAYRMAIAACFVFQREISRSVFRDFFDSIDPTRTFPLFADIPVIQPLPAPVHRRGR